MTPSASSIPRYVAFDTSGPEGSVAVGSGSIDAVVLIGERDEHAARLIPAIDDALSRAAAELRGLDGIVVGEGPGSFTGVRVAAATAKALAGAVGIHLFSVSSLAAAALAARIGSIRYVLFDARGDRVYGACYAVDETSLETVIAPHGGALHEVLAGEVPIGCVFVGDASLKHRGVIEAAGFEVYQPSPGAASLAEGLLRYMQLHPGIDPVADVAIWEPRYIRASSAERIWGR